MPKYGRDIYRRDGEIKRKKIRLHILYARFHSVLYHFPATKASRECGNMCRISVIRTNERENNPTRYGDINARAYRQKYNNAFGGFMHRSYICFSRFVRVTKRFYRSFFRIVFERCEITCSCMYEHRNLLTIKYKLYTCSVNLTS